MAMKSVIHSRYPDYRIYENGTIIRISTGAKLFRTPKAYLIVNKYHKELVYLPSIIYEAFHKRPIYEDEDIKFKDGNKLNWEIGNLELIHKIRIKVELLIDPNRLPKLFRYLDRRFKYRIYY